jgi:dihydrofolate reductase
VTVVNTVDEALAKAGDAPEHCVIGGEEIFRLTLPMARRLHLTQIHARVGGDAKFPVFDRSAWRETERIEHPVDERHAYAMTFLTLDRVA